MLPLYPLWQEVELYKTSHRDKLGLMVCYRTDEEEDLGIYVGEVGRRGVGAGPLGGSGAPGLLLRRRTPRLHVAPAVGRAGRRGGG